MLRTKFSERQARQWSVSRENGKIKWILTHGVMGWGTTMFMWMTAWKLFTHGQDFVTRREIIVDLCIWPIAGFFFGWWMWYASEKAYKSFSDMKLTKEPNDALEPKTMAITPAASHPSRQP